VELITIIHSSILVLTQLTAILARGDVANVVLKQTGPKNILMLFGFKVFKRMLRFLGYYVSKYEGTRFPECKKMPATILLPGLHQLLLPAHGLGKQTAPLLCT